MSHSVRASIAESDVGADSAFVDVMVVWWVEVGRVCFCLPREEQRLLLIHIYTQRVSAIGGCYLVSGSLDNHYCMVCSQFDAAADLS